ncbi:MAG: amidohydrolase family protein [Planctomycetota bacterium]
MRLLLPLATSSVLLAAAAAQPAATKLAFTGMRLLPIEGPEVERGVLVVQGGKIVAAGAVSVPADAQVIDLAGKVVMPGLVCSHTHVGAVAGGDGSAPLHPDVRALDAINVRDPGIQKAQAGGITTVNCMPGSGHLMSGQTVYMKLRDGNTIDDLALRWPDGSVMGGLKMANGTNPMRGKPPFPGTRGKSMALMRALYVKAREYQAKVAAAGDDPSKRPERDLGMEALGEALSGKRVVHFHTHRHDDILSVLRLRQEFGLRVVLHHVSDAAKVAGEIAAAGVACSVIVVDSPGGKLEAIDVGFGNGAALERAGARVGFHTDDPITDSRLFLRSAALAVRAGMSREAALRGLTLENARILDLDARIGSLVAGKDADFVVLDGDPLSVRTHVEQTWVDGVKVFDRSDPRDKKWATGGYGASDDQAFTLCCYGNGAGNQEGN